MLDLENYIKAENAKFAAECKAEGATMWGETVSDPAHWAECDVYTVEDYKRYSLAAYISDVSKEAQGFRTRVDWKSASIEELEEDADYFSKYAAEERKLEEAREEAAVADFKELVKKTIALGARDEETALRWLTQGETFYHGQCVEHYVYNCGILFTDYGKELVKKLGKIVTFEDWDEEAA